MNYEQMNNNIVYLTGTVVSDPVFSHETYGEGFYELNIEIPRLSGTTDIIPITVSEKLIENGKFNKGQEVSIKGQFRSYNKLDDEKSKLMLTVFVREAYDLKEDMPKNLIEISGYVCKEPIFRVTPFKREICDILIAVNRAYKKSDYLPCIAWGRNARYLKEAVIGDKLSMVGRIQSRAYQKKLDDGTILDKIAYEVSINRVDKANDAEKNDRAI